MEIQPTARLGKSKTESGLTSFSNLLVELKCYEAAYQILLLGAYNLPVFRKISAINRLILPAGLELRRKIMVKTNGKNYKKSATSGKIIELIGVQGVGKTTFSNAVYHKMRSRWLYRHEVEFNGPASIGHGEIESLHEDIYKRKIDKLKNLNLDSWEFLTSSYQISRGAYESLCISTASFPKGIILDEGLFKNFAEEILSLELQESISLWTPRAFVYLKARDPELVAKRFMQRAQARRAKGIFQHEKNMDEIVQRINKYTSHYEAIVDRANYLGRPVLEIIAEEDLDRSICKIVEFENELIGNN